MGCASSKIDELPAVLLCRERLHHLSQALHHRYSLAEAHLSYIHSLQSLGLSLHHFFDTAASLPPPPSPPVNLPLHRKISNDNSAHLYSSHSDSGSHLNFHSDSEDDGDEDLHDHGSGSESGSGHLRLHNELEGPTSGGMMMYEESGFGGGGSGFGSGMDFNQYLYSSDNNGYNINYMKKHVTPSVSYEQRPVSYDTQTVQFGDPSSTSNSNYYDYFVANNNGNINGYMSSYGGVAYFEGAQRGGGGGGGGWNNGMPPQQMGPPKQQAAPPPPPPPATSAWDFMNFFESIEENHYPTFRNSTPSSTDSREVREEEGIPDLEDEDYAHEVVKEVHGHQKLVVDEGGNSGGGEEKGGGESKRGEVVQQQAAGVSEVESKNVYRGRPSASIESAPAEYEVRMVDKKVVGEEGKGDGGGKGGGGFRNVFEVVKEIQVQFDRAAKSGGELGSVLEIGKLRYQRKNAASQG